MSNKDKTERIKFLDKPLSPNYFTLPGSQIGVAFTILSGFNCNTRVTQVFFQRLLDSSALRYSSISVCLNVNKTGKMRCMFTKETEGETSQWETSVGSDKYGILFMDSPGTICGCISGYLGHLCCYFYHNKLTD